MATSFEVLLLPAIDRKRLHPSHGEPMRTRVIKCGLAGIAAFAGASCLDLGPMPVGPCVSADGQLGLFEGRASGASTDSVTGCAFFGTSNPGGSGMVLTSGRVTDSRPMVKVIGPIPFPGTLVAGNGDVGTFYGVIFLDRRRFPVTGGTVTKTLASAARVEGTIDITGTDSVGVTITVRGRFLARCQEDLNDPDIFSDGPKEPRVGGPCDPNASGAR